MTTNCEFPIIDINSIYQSSALHAAAMNSKSITVRFLLDKHLCDVNIKDHNGNTPLHIAFRYKNVDVANLLLAYGARIDILNNDNKTPEFYRIRNDYILINFT